MRTLTAILLLLLGLLAAPRPTAAHTIILEPNGGEVFTAGETITIRWAIGIAHDLQNWDLRYTLDDPTTDAACANDATPSWQVLETNIPPTCTEGGGGLCSPGPCVMTYLWTIPDSLVSSAAKIRVRMDNSGVDYWDRSDAPFTILAPTAVPAGAPSSPLTLQANQPNPFYPTTTITFALLRPAPLVRLAIYDARGALVSILIEGAQPQGRRSVMWDGTNAEGARVASGVYFYRLEVGDQSATRKMTLVR